MLRKLEDKLRCRCGEGYVGVVMLALCAMLVLAPTIRVLPVFIAKQRLDALATELVREAGIPDKVDLETSQRAAALREKTGPDPGITRSVGGRIQLDSKVTASLILQINIGLFGDLGLSSIMLRAQATGKSEVYWK